MKKRCMSIRVLSISASGSRAAIASHCEPGDKRWRNLISTRDGRNIRRSLDGARLTWVKGDWTVDLLAARPTLENSDYFDNPPNHSQGFWAAYAVHPFRFLPRGNIDLYYMGLDNKSVAFDSKGTGREQRETIGTRLWGTTEHWLAQLRQSKSARTSLHSVQACWSSGYSALW
jgi:hypothetical protein